jgi:hypothetical protein
VLQNFQRVALAHEQVFLTIDIAIILQVLLLRAGPDQKPGHMMRSFLQRLVDGPLPHSPWSHHPQISFVIDLKVNSPRDGRPVNHLVMDALVVSADGVAFH